jgi:hypothetical protein
MNSCAHSVELELRGVIIKIRADLKPSQRWRLKDDRIWNRGIKAYMNSMSRLGSTGCSINGHGTGAMKEYPAGPEPGTLFHIEVVS